ncbi:hypothetical protein GV791_00825 [Nocardia cyriacigeorgica]|uniref:Uncharacterized protein n=1 Tax=Nocardia cyriacigeorgica TaxID=135487 RepID=A0A6P1CIK1_9NOCA|nr:hypothetical protein [Nocardia cyriacigeorgica]NEW31104.1 hypothetical protein [Nocardia cyriacigeorgica]
MIDAYHHPAPFRYSANAFLASSKSVLEMVRLDMEKEGENAWRNERVGRVLADDLFTQFNLARNFVIHRGSLIRSSQVEVGLFSYRRLKLALSTELKTDEPSHVLIKRVANSDSASMFVHPDRPFIGEQLGVRRVYREPQLSTEHDVLTATDMILSQLCNLVDDCHARLGVPFDDDAHNCCTAHDLEQHATLLETDIDPSLVEQWGWD